MADPKRPQISDVESIDAIWQQATTSPMSESDWLDAAPDEDAAAEDDAEDEDEDDDEDDDDEDDDDEDDDDEDDEDEEDEGDDVDK